VEAPVREGVGVVVRTDRDDRPGDVYGGTTTLVSGPGRQSYPLVPFVPRAAEKITARRGPFPESRRS
jgi:hypothetical protein